MGSSLRPYQNTFVTAIARALIRNRKIVAQLPTGGGKTMIFSSISQRFISRSAKDVLILVHRKELLAQTRRTLYTCYGITCQVIVAGMRCVPHARVYVGMVESTNKRIDRIKNIGLVIIDEAHLALHNKMHAHWQEALIIGFTATPVSANRKQPMKNWYSDIICGPSIGDLIKLNALCQNITLAPRDTVDRNTLAIKNGEFDDSAMSLSFSRPRYILNTVDAYEKWAKGTKTIIFNVTVEHSKLVCAAFVQKGCKCKHIDGGTNATERAHALRWFKTTQDAILCNVGIATMGFDEPTIETVIFNKSTLSATLWIQCCGRGSRPTDEKSAFTIIDMGGNAVMLGDWCDERDWKQLFFYPPAPGEAGGVAPCKNCPQCEAIVAANALACKYCGYVFPVNRAEQREENPLSEFIVVTKGIDVEKIIRHNKNKKEYFSFFAIGTQLAQQARKTIPKLTSVQANFILGQCLEKSEQWCKLKGRHWNQWHYETARDHLITQLRAHFKTWTEVKQENENKNIPV